MNAAWKSLIVGCATTLLTSAAFAQSAPAAQNAAKSECARARNPQNCEARQKAMASCRDKTGPARRACIEDAMPPRDCTQSKNPQRCEAQQKAREACKGTEGKTRRSCMREQLKKKPKK